MDQERVLRLPVRQAPEVSRARISSIRKAMRGWDMSIAQVALGLGVSRQYVWGILQGRAYVSPNKLEEIERLLQIWIETRREALTTGQRMRAARRRNCMTLKEIADLIGYSWVAVERWEKDVCLPKPGVLWHLQHIYRVNEEWTPIYAAEFENSIPIHISSPAFVGA